MHDESPCWLAPCCSALLPLSANTTHWEYGEAGPAKWASLTPNMASVLAATASRRSTSVWWSIWPLQFHQYQAGGKTLVTKRPHGAGQLCPAAP